MTTLPFWKVEAIGNDFPLLQASDAETYAKAKGVSLDYGLAELAVRLADRHFGVGGDGLLVLDPALNLRMFNPDGTEDFCGNGIRCAVQFAHAMGWASDKGTLTHGGRAIPFEIRDGGMIATTIGQASYDPAKVPTDRLGETFNAEVWSGMDAGMPLSLFGSALTTGSTHVVIPTSMIPDDDSFKSVSAKIEVDPRYPQRTSVIWSQEVSPGVLQIRIWERGVGETEGCGTGSSAAAADYLRRKGGSGPVEVRNPGGTVRVLADRWDAPLTIEGTAQIRYTGNYLI